MKQANLAPNNADSTSYVPQRGRLNHPTTHHIFLLQWLLILCQFSWTMLNLKIIFCRWDQIILQGGGFFFFLKYDAQGIIYWYKIIAMTFISVSCHFQIIPWSKFTTSMKLKWTGPSHHACLYIINATGTQTIH